MYVYRFLNDIVKPWDELNALLGMRIALDPELSDVTRLAGGLAVAIRHQVEVLRMKDSVANQECPDHKIISDTADFWKHGALRDSTRNIHLSTQSLFEFKEEKGFSFLRNTLIVEHASLGEHDFLATSLSAINYWIGKHHFNIAWKGEIFENPPIFHEEAFLNHDPKKCILLKQVRLGFLSRNANGNLERADPKNIRFAVY